MKTVGIIPSRYDASRFPGKPLVDIMGKTMIQRVYEQAKNCQCLSDLVVATDDQRIFDHVLSFGGKAIMTSSDHLTGTDRCVEALQTMDETYDVVINIQGDEPILNPSQISLLSFCFNDDACQIATLAVPVKTPELLFDPSKIKVVLDHHGRAMYFSRHAIPYQRSAQDEWHLNHRYYKHVGIYAFKTEVLLELGKLPPTDLERAESLEQLRWMENGYSIEVRITEFDSISVDVPEDVDRVCRILNAG